MRIKKFSTTISGYLFDQRAILNIRTIPSCVDPSRESVQPPQTHNGTKFHSGSCSAVTRASTGPLVREIRSAESIGFGVIAVSRLSARNTIRQEDSEVLCLPCPALPCPARERRTCPASIPGGNLPIRHPPVVPPRSAVWPSPSLWNRFTTGRLDHLWLRPFPILPADFIWDGKRVDHFSASPLPLARISRQYSRRYTRFLWILDEQKSNYQFDYESIMLMVLLVKWILECLPSNTQTHV